MPILTLDPQSPFGSATASTVYNDPIYDIDDVKSGVFSFAGGVANGTAFVRGEIVNITGGTIAKLAAIPNGTTPTQLAVIPFACTKESNRTKTTVYVGSLGLRRELVTYGTLTNNATTHAGINPILAAQGIEVRSQVE